MNRTTKLVILFAIFIISLLICDALCRADTDPNALSTFTITRTITHHRSIVTEPNEPAPIDPNTPADPNTPSGGLKYKVIRNAALEKPKPLLKILIRDLTTKVEKQE